MLLSVHFLNRVDTESLLDSQAEDAAGELIFIFKRLLFLCTLP